MQEKTKQAKRMLSLVMTVLLMAALLAGCSDVTNITMNENGSGSYEETASISKSLLDQASGGMISDDTILSYMKTLLPQAELSISNEDVNGTESKVIRAKMNFKNTKEFQKVLSNREMLSVKFSPAYFSRSPIYMPVEDEDEGSALTDDPAAVIGSNEELMNAVLKEIQNMEVKMTIAFPYKVSKTNGKIGEDGKTVVWDLSQDNDITRLYAVFQTANSLKAPAFTGAENGKYYNTGVTVIINSENMLDYVDVDGQKIESDYLFLSEESSYRLTAVDINGNKSTIRFFIDTTKPSVSGAVNGKTYTGARTIKFSDKGSGIQKAALNGKTIKSGTKVSKKGSYTLVVTDKAGNKKTVKFKIK